jgi:SAM-dependent methyltransferase
VKDPYRRIAKRYDSFVERPNVVLRQVALKMAAPTKGMRVLEVGCGTGSNLQLYHRAGCEVFGIDLSPSMLAVAKEKLGDTAELRLGDAADMPYEDGSVDLVTAFLTLHDHRGPIRFPNGWFFKAVIVALEIAAGREHYRNYRDFLSRRGLPGMLEGRNLREDRTKTLSAGNMLAMVVTAG